MACLASRWAVGPTARSRWAKALAVQVLFEPAVDGLFGQPLGGRADGKEPLGQGAGHSDHIVGDRLVGQADGGGLFAGKHLAGQDQLLGPGRADQPR
jgi:hypothetical protein